MTEKIIVAFDIGHGIDTYPPNKGIGNFAEFSFNNAVVKLAKPLAELNGFKVFLPQPFDSKEVPLNSRILAIKANRCKLVISTHGNAGVSSANGREAWYWQESLQSERLANLWLANSESLKTNNRGSKKSNYDKGRNFAITRDNHKNNIPAIITECGFFTNDKERALMQTDDFQMKCAIAMVKTTCDYFNMPFKLEADKEVVELKQQSTWSIQATNWALENKVSDCSRLADIATREEVITMLYKYDQYLNSKE